MPVYVVLQGNVVDREKIDEYSAKAGPMVIGGGGKILAADDQSEVIEGQPGTRTVLIEFEDRAAFRAWYDSAEYQEIVGLRLEAAPGTMIVADGFVMPGG